MAAQRQGLGGCERFSPGNLLTHLLLPHQTCGEIRDRAVTIVQVGGLAAEVLSVLEVKGLARRWARNLIAIVIAETLTAIHDDVVRRMNGRTVAKHGPERNDKQKDSSARRSKAFHG